MIYYRKRKLLSTSSARLMSPVCCWSINDRGLKETERPWVRLWRGCGTQATTLPGSNQGVNPGSKSCSSHSSKSLLHPWLWRLVQISVQPLFKTPASPWLQPFLEHWSQNWDIILDKLRHYPSVHTFFFHYGNYVHIMIYQNCHQNTTCWLQAWTDGVLCVATWSAEESGDQNRIILRLSDRNFVTLATACGRY